MNINYKKTIIMNRLVNGNDGYFYKDNCRLYYSNIHGWYCKDNINGKINTYNKIRL
jgi:PhoPQ-activated pathogenicity-related protein